MDINDIVRNALRQASKAIENVTLVDAPCGAERVVIVVSADERTARTVEQPCAQCYKELKELRLSEVRVRKDGSLLCGSCSDLVDSFGGCR